MVYVAYNVDGTASNIIEISPENVAKYEALTGFTLRIPVFESSDEDRPLRPSYEELEQALNELGVETRE